MIKKILLTFLLLFSNYSFSQEINDNISTYYFIRHAEKDRSDTINPNPHLNEKGLARAEKWKNVFSNIEFDIIYSTDYFRTKETALPTATSKHLEITLYNPREFKTETFLNETRGKTVLIVGHSNTTPLLVNAIIGKEKYKMIKDNNNANLYIVSISNTDIHDQLLVIE